MPKSSESTHSSFNLARLLSLVRPHAALFIVGMLGLGIGSGINLLLPEIVRRLLDSDWSRTLIDHPWWTAAFLVGLFALQALAFYIRSYYFGIVGQRVVTSVRVRLYRSIMRQEIEFFDANRGGDLVSRLGADTQLLQDAVSVKLSVFLRYSMQVAVGLVMMLLISWRLTLTIIFTLPFIVGLSIVLGKKLRRISKQQQAALGQAATVAEETIAGARIIKAFGREQSQEQRYEAEAQRVLALGVSRSGVSAFFSSFVSWLMNAAIVVVLLVGVQLVAQQQLTYGDLTAFLLYGVIVAVSFAFVASGYAEFLQALGAGERIFEIIESPAANVQHAAPPRLQGDGGVEFRDVSFSYPSRLDIQVLHSISFKIAPGQTTALVGPSGSGKSTLVALLLGFYPPEHGAIIFDGVDVSTATRDAVRSHCAVVPQEPQLFGVSIADNLRFGKEDASDTELQQVCAAVHLKEFVDSLPAGLQTNVGERGLQLSGGQKQRLAIARAMLKNPKLLILDEATSALDSENEHLVQEALSLLMKDRTTLVIAHRLSTIKRADQVIVIDRGEVLQRGTHESLCREHGLYKQLVERQELLHDSRV